MIIIEFVVFNAVVANVIPAHFQQTTKEELFMISSKYVVNNKWTHLLFFFGANS